MEQVNDSEEKNDIRAEVTPKEQVSKEDLEALLGFFRRGYGERWIGDENFWNVMAKNFTELLRLYDKDQLAAALLIDTRRISDIAVNPDFQGRGLGVRLFKEAASVHPDVWISVGINAEGMLATVTDKDLHYLPVEDKQKIGDLFEHTNRAKGDHEVEVSEVEVPLLSKRLKAKNINQDRFLAFHRVNATHGAAYRQILFQNQG